MVRCVCFQRFNGLPAAFQGPRRSSKRLFAGACRLFSCTCRPADLTRRPAVCIQYCRSITNRRKGKTRTGKEGRKVTVSTELFPGRAPLTDRGLGKPPRVLSRSSPHSSLRRTSHEASAKTVQTPAGTGPAVDLRPGPGCLSLYPFRRFLARASRSSNCSRPSAAWISSITGLAGPTGPS